MSIWSLFLFLAGCIAVVIALGFLGILTICIVTAVRDVWRGRDK